MMNMSLIILEEKYGAIDSDYSSCSGYYIIKFYSCPYILQSDLSIDGQVISYGQMVCERNHFFPIKIYTGRVVRGGKYNIKGSHLKDKRELKGYLFIIYLWTQGTYSITDMRVVNTDSTLYQYKTPKKCLETYEKDKKKKYLDTWFNQCRNLTQRKLLLLPIYVLGPIYLDLNLDPNDPDEPYAEVII